MRGCDAMVLYVWYVSIWVYIYVYEYEYDGVYVRNYVICVVYVCGWSCGIEQTV